MRPGIRLLTVLLGFLVVSTFGQQNKIAITFIGNCGIFMTDGEINLYVDFPYKSGAHHYMTYDDSIIDTISAGSVFLFTHGHSDHYRKKLFKKTGQKLYGPWPVTLFLSKKRKYTLEELNDSFINFSVLVFKTKHRFTFKHFSYLINWNSKRIFISGDAESAKTISEIKNIDLVFAPSWLIKDAFVKELGIDAKKIILYHHRADEKINNKSDKVVVPFQGQKFEL